MIFLMCDIMTSSSHLLGMEYMKRTSHFFTLALLLSLPAVTWACLWDYDTLRQERSRFPSTLEIITGKFLRHSPEFYQWRVQDRLQKLKADPNNLNYLDDLAVAYHKLGQHDRAIEIMQQKDKISPNLYETEANISTFYFYKGDLEKSLYHVDRALKINPNAHFGREKYQKYLIEYLLSLQKERWWNPSFLSFGEFLVKTNREPNLFRNLDNRQEAIKAVLGMMRFADHKAPVLLEALASVLTDGSSDLPKQDAKRLAARAYLRLSLVSQSEESRQYYRKLAGQTLEMVLSSSSERHDSSQTLHEIEQHFLNELKDADAWYAQVRNDEIRWISEGKNVDSEFDKKYYEEPNSETTEPSPNVSSLEDKILQVGKGFMIVLILIGIFLGVFIIRFLIKARKS